MSDLFVETLELKEEIARLRADEKRLQAVVDAARIVVELWGVDAGNWPVAVDELGDALRALDGEP